MRLRRLPAFIAIAVALAAAARAEVCVDVPPGQYTPNATVCVSSVLKSQGANTYGPENLRDDTAKAWCEGAPGNGQGEYVRIGWAGPVEFRSIIIGNGYQKNRETYFNNARARTVRIETGDGLSVAAELPDTGARHTIRLPRVAKTNSLRVTIVDAYGGDKYSDLCHFYLSPNFEEANTLN
jgi:hypothetical protein